MSVVYPIVNNIRSTQNMIDVFGGYNHNMKIGGGEFYDMENLTSSYFPLMASRDPRGIVKQLENPLTMIGKAQLAYIDGSHFYYNGIDLTSYLSEKGFTISLDEKMMPKKLVSMGAYICIFPDKLYINTEKYSDCGSMEANFSTEEGATISYTMCKMDGTEYGNAPASNEAPEEPANGDLWIDTSGSVHSLKIYSSTSEMWTSIATVYTKISATNIGQQFKEYDGVQISGCEYVGDSDTLKQQIEDLNGSKIIYARDDNYIVVIGLLDAVVTQTTGSVAVKRKVPEMDFITEAQNRLWGCKFGLVEGKTVNEIYCCALGDFKNWEQYLGTAADSYRASVGTDGEWTGAVTHLGYPLFFKENHMHKVYVSSTGAHQIVDNACRGVQKGSSDSLVVVDERLYYKSDSGVVSYDGSLPIAISPQFGTEKYYEASAGSVGSKYYISMRDSNENWHMFVYDTSRDLWHREDDTHALFFSKKNNELYFIDANSNNIMSALGTIGDKASPIRWSATSGLIGYQYVNQKYISRVVFRMMLPRGSDADMYVEYDSSGIWKHCGHMRGRGTNSFEINIKPLRCDHFRIKLEGVGKIRIYSRAEVIEEGSSKNVL